MKDWEIRFVDEYNQLKDRTEKLHKIIVKYEANTLEFRPNCSIELLKEQENAMRQYMYILEVRSQVEGIDLYDNVSRAIGAGGSAEVS